MKKLIFLIALAFSTMITSCSDEESIVQDSAKTSSSSAKLGKEGILYTYISSKEYISESQTALTQLALDDSEYIANNSNVTKIINKVKKVGGLGLVVEKHYVNVQTGKIIKSLFLNELTFQYTIGNVNQPLSGTPVNDIIANCPSGTTFLGSCMGTSGQASYSFCVANIAGTYALNTASDGCSSMIQVNALFSSSFCGGGC